MRAQPITRKRTPQVRRAPSATTIKVRVLFFENVGAWSAQVLEYDIATQANTLEGLFYEVERILMAYVALAAEDGHPPFEGIPPAPEKYWEIFKKSRIRMRRPAAGIVAANSPGTRIRNEIRLAERIAA